MQCTLNCGKEKKQRKELWLKERKQRNELWVKERKQRDELWLVEKKTDELKCFLDFDYELLLACFAASTEFN